MAPLFAGRASAGPIRRRVCRLDELTTGTPKAFSLVGTRQDAWLVFPRETIGRVWVIRRTDEDCPPEEAKVEIFSAICPHLGCTIQLDGSGESFVCPCHQAYFDLLGEAFSAEQLGERLNKSSEVKNPSPRGMDLLASEGSNLVQDKETGQWWVEVEYQRFQPGMAEKIAAS